MKILFTLLTFITPIVSYAQTIDFIFENLVISSTGVATIKIIPPLVDLNKYRVRPVVTTGTVYIKGNTGEWVGSTEKWTELPLLKKTIDLKFSPISVRSVCLKLQLQDVRTGKIYETPEIVLEHALKKEEYIKNLNAGFMQRTELISENSLNETTLEVSSATNDQKARINPSILVTLFVTSIAFSIIALGALFKSSPPV